MLKYKIPQIVTLTPFQTYKAVCLIPQVYRVSRLTLGLTEPCKPAQFGHKKRELL